MTRNRLIGLVAAALLVAVVGVGFVFLAPLQIGGRTAYVITSGSSMEPTFHANDLVLTRVQDTYEVGDIVLYRSSTLDRNVLHRIVALDGQRFVLQGDNNDYLDPEHPTAGQIRGQVWFFVPGAGRVVGWLRQPLVLAAIAFFVLFGLLAGGREASRRRAPRAASDPEPVRISAARPEATLAVPRTVLAGAGGAFVLFALLAVVAFGRPAQRTVEIADAWRHAGTFSYEAAVPRSAVYPDGAVATGDTVFTNLVSKLRVAFAYTYSAEEAYDVHGGVALDAVVSDGQGWSRSIPIRSAQPFEGSTASIEGALDLRAIRSAVDRMKELTGSTTTVFTVSVAPTVQLAGYAGTALIDETYRPALDFQLDSISMRPAAGTDDAAPTFDVEEAGSATARAARTIGLGTVTLSVAGARSLALLGLLVSLLAAGASAAVLLRRAASDEAGRIQARYGSRIVAAEVEIPDGRWITDVRTIDELARIAEHYDRVILRNTRFGDEYVVDDGVAVYRYTAGGAQPVARSTLPVGNT